MGLQSSDSNYNTLATDVLEKSYRICVTALSDWAKILLPLFHPIRSKTKTNRDWLALAYPRFASATCVYFEF